MFRISHKKGFTLIELLVVIAIIALLAAILFPVFARARENARKSSCMNNLKQIGIGMAQYSQDFDEQTTPLRWRWTGAYSEMPFQSLLYPYIKSTQIYKCPSNTSTGNMDDTPRAANPVVPAMPKSYLANAGDEGGGGTNATRPMSDATNSRSMADMPFPSSTILIVEHTNNQNADCYSTGTVAGMKGHLGTSNFLFGDAHVKSLRPSATSTGRCMWTLSNGATSGATTPGTCNGAWHTALTALDTNAQFN